MDKQFELKDGKVHCKCGNHAVKFRDGYLCSGITIPHGCTYKEEDLTKCKYGWKRIKVDIH